MTQLISTLRFFSYFKIFANSTRQVVSEYARGVRVDFAAQNVGVRKFDGCGEFHTGQFPCPTSGTLTGGEIFGRVPGFTKWKIIRRAINERAFLDAL